jgi:dTDP-4-dehydrorhamnose 3,5-epimerase
MRAVTANAKGVAASSGTSSQSADAIGVLANPADGLKTADMRVEPTDLPDVLILTPARFGDDRGWFSETFSAARMVAAGLTMEWVQDNHSMSARPGTLRGLHYQAPPHAQDKLVRCTRGAILDVAVDFRRGSPTFGNWVGVELNPDNGRQLFVPKGFLHGFVTLGPGSEVLYKCSDVYAPSCDGAIRWDDPDIGIDWGVDAPRLSAKDSAAPYLRDVESPFDWNPA